MAVPLYMDHNVSGAITDGLRSRGVDVVTAFEDERNRVEDPELLDRSTELGRLLFTNDDDLLAEAAARQRSGQFFSGVVYAAQKEVSIGQCVEDLEVIGKAGSPEDFTNAVEYLPL